MHTIEHEAPRWHRQSVPMRLLVDPRGESLSNHGVRSAGFRSLHFGPDDERIFLLHEWGKCIKQIKTGEPHAGCRCPDGFEGRHCQYREGTAPDAELKIAFAEQEHHVEGFLLFFIIIIVGGVLGVFGYVIYGNMYARPPTTMKDIEDSTRDLQLDMTEMNDKPNGEMT